MKLLLCLTIALSLIFHASFCSVNNQSRAYTIHEDFMLGCYHLSGPTPDGIIKSMRSVDKREENGNTIFMYEFMFLQSGKGSFVAECFEGLRLEDVFINGRPPTTQFIFNHNGEIKRYKFESDTSGEFQLITFEATASTKSALDLGYCLASIECDEPSELENRIRMMPSWEPKTFRKNVSELRLALRLQNNPNVLEKKLHKHMNAFMLITAWNVLELSTSPDKYEDAAMIIDIVEKEEKNIARSYVEPVIYLFLRVARRLGIKNCYSNQIRASVMDPVIFEDVLVFHLEKNNLPPLSSAIQIFEDVIGPEKTRYVDYNGKDFDKLRLEVLPQFQQIIRKHVFVNQQSFLDSTGPAFDVYEHDFPIWIMEEKTTSTLWTSFGKEHMFPKDAMKHIDPSEFNVKLDTEIVYLRKTENGGSHKTTLAKLLSSEEGLHFLKQNEHLAKYEDERYQRLKEAQRKRAQELRELSKERIKKEQEEKQRQLEKEVQLKKEQEAELIRLEKEKALKEQQELEEQLRREKEEQINKQKELARLQREEEKKLKKQRDEEQLQLRLAEEEKIKTLKENERIQHEEKERTEKPQVSSTNVDYSNGPNDVEKKSELSRNDDNYSNTPNKDSIVDKEYPEGTDQIESPVNGYQETQDKKSKSSKSALGAAGGPVLKFGSFCAASTIFTVVMNILTNGAIIHCIMNFPCCVRIFEKAPWVKEVLKFIFAVAAMTATVTALKNTPAATVNEAISAVSDGSMVVLKIVGWSLGILTTIGSIVLAVLRKCCCCKEKKIDLRQYAHRGGGPRELDESYSESV
eukprot:592347_1